MPLRDHFRPPVTDKHSWDEVHGGWPMMIVRDLFSILPAGYTASPNVHLGPMFEIVSSFENAAGGLGNSFGSTNGGVATGTAPSPTLTLEADLSEFDEYEVRIYDEERGRRLVAAIELVSPSNKDRPESRRAFLAKSKRPFRKKSASPSWISSPFRTSISTANCWSCWTGKTRNSTELRFSSTRSRFALRKRPRASPHCSISGSIRWRWARSSDPADLAGPRSSRPASAREPVTKSMCRLLHIA